MKNQVDKKILPADVTFHSTSQNQHNRHMNGMAMFAGTEAHKSPTARILTKANLATSVYEGVICQPAETSAESLIWCYYLRR